MPPRSKGLARRLAANTLHAASGRVIALALWLVLTPFILRALGPEGFGVWSLFFALTGYLGALDLGFSQATLRFVAAADATEDRAKGGEVATLSVAGYVVLGALWLLVLPPLRESILGFLRIPGALHAGASFAITAGAIVFALAGCTNTCVAALQGSGRFDLANAVLVVVSLVQAAGIVLAIRMNAGLAGMVSATAAAWTLALLVGVAALAAAVPGFRWSSPARALAHARELLRFGGPMQLANVLGVVHQQVDKVLLSRFVALAAVAPYELGLRVSTATSTFSQLLLLAMLPAASALHAAGDRGGLEQLHRRANRYVLTVAAVLTAALVGGATPLLAAWLGSPPAGAALALRGLVLVAYLAIAAGVGGAIARGAGRTDLEAELSALALAVHLVLALALVPRLGLPGALVAIAAGNALGMLWFLARLAVALGWNRVPVMLEPLGWPLLMIAAGVAAGWALQHLALPGFAGTPWPRFVLQGAGASLVAAAVAVSTRFISWREALSLLSPSRKADG
jgi:O-antigen/teichoic acid export membrane protein